MSELQTPWKYDPQRERVSCVRYDASVTDPLGVPWRDHMEYFIDKILEHCGDFKKKTEIEFLVSWLGYAWQHITWKPQKN